MVKPFVTCWMHQAPYYNEHLDITRFLPSGNILSEMHFIELDTMHSFVSTFTASGKVGPIAVTSTTLPPAVTRLPEGVIAVPAWKICTSTIKLN